MSEPTPLKGSFKPVFNFGFNQRILPHGASSGVFDENKSVHLVISSSTNKIVLQHSGNFFK